MTFVRADSRARPWRVTSFSSSSLVAEPRVGRSRVVLPVVAVLAALVLAGCVRQETPPPEKSAKAGGSTVRDFKQPVEVTPVMRRDLSETTNVVGSLAQNESAELRAEISGLVRGIFFEEGQAVKKGTVLVKIDDAELQAQLAQAEARFQLTEVNLERTENLRKTQSTTLAEYDRARTESASARADLAVLRLRLEKTEIKAPFDGIVGVRSLSAGDYVTSQTAITKIDDLSRLKIEFQVAERFLSKLRPGTRFRLTSRLIEAGQSVEGEVYFVSSVIDRATRASLVKGFVINPPPSLKPGMFANVEVVLDVRPGALSVPEGAILQTATSTQVIVARPNGAEVTADFVPVTLGLRSRGWVEVSPIKGELPENTRVVASGVGGLVLFQGARLDPRPLKAAFQTADE